MRHWEPRSAPGPRPAAVRLVPAFLAAALLACLLPGTVLATDFRFTPDDRFIVEIDGDRNPDARVFASADGSRFLVDLPSEKRVVFIDPAAKTAAAVPRQDVARQTDGSIRMNDRFAWSAPGYAFSVRGTAWRFQTEKSSVVVTPVRRTGEEKSEEAAVAAGAPAVAEAPADANARAAAATAAPSSAGPPSSNPAAGECVSLVTRPASGVPGCTQAVYLRNTCEVPVLATLQRTEHLMTGPLPQVFSQAVVPGEHWLGCSWWSGAMAPAQHAIVGAAFFNDPAGPPGRHGRGSRH